MSIESIYKKLKKLFKSDDVESKEYIEKRKKIVLSIESKIEKIKVKLKTAKTDEKIDKLKDELEVLKNMKRKLKLQSIN
jgi:hypothetical protein